MNTMQKRSLEEIHRAAVAELSAERQRMAIEAEKNRLRAQRGKSLWQRLTSWLPFTIKWKGKS